MEDNRIAVLKKNGAVVDHVYDVLSLERFWRLENPSVGDKYEVEIKDSDQEDQS